MYHLTINIIQLNYNYLGRLRWLCMDKESTRNAGDIGDAGLITESERSPGGAHGNPLQYSFLENPMDRRAWWAMVHRFAESQTQNQE